MFLYVLYRFLYVYVRALARVQTDRVQRDKVQTCRPGLDRQSPGRPCPDQVGRDPGRQTDRPFKGPLKGKYTQNIAKHSKIYQNIPKTQFYICFYKFYIGFYRFLYVLYRFVYVLYRFLCIHPPTR